MRKFVNLMVGVALLSTAAIAQSLPLAGPVVPEEDGVYQLNYAGNLGAGQSFVNITNAGTLNGFDPLGDICANVYVFDQQQELIACCACPLTPNHLRTLSVQNDLINNTLTPGVPTGVTIALLASLPPGNPSSCDATTPKSTNLVRGMKAWGTKLHVAPGGGFFGTETVFEDAELSASELFKLTSWCGFIQANGSKFGICNVCKDGAQGAKRN